MKTTNTFRSQPPTIEEAKVAFAKVNGVVVVKAEVEPTATMTDVTPAGFGPAE